jgi:hypothetical protein
VPPQEFISTPEKKPTVLILVCLLLLILGLVVFARFHSIHTTDDSGMGPRAPTEIASNNVPIVPQKNVVNPSMPDSLVVLYSTKATETEVDNRYWPTLNIWGKEGNRPPELIATVGTVGEYPSQIVMSPDHNYVAVDVETGVYLVDLKTRVMKKVYSTVGGNIIGVIFSRDSSSLVVSDENSITIVKFITGSGQILKQKLADHNPKVGDVLPIVLRNDGVLLYEPVSYKDCWLAIGAMTFDHGEMYATSTNIYPFAVSTNGMVAIGDDVESIPNPDSEMCGTGKISTVVSIVEPVTNTMLGRVGVHGMAFNFVAYSPDTKTVLYKASSDKWQTHAYYLQDINNSSVPRTVADPYTILQAWKAEEGPVTAWYSPETRPTDDQMRSLYVNNQPILISESMPSLIVQYYR